MLEADHFTTLLDWITNNPSWAGLGIFLLSASESLAVIGLFIPAAPLMIAIGGLVGAGALDLTSTMIWAILGAIAGDFASYILGFYFKERLNNMWPFSRHPNWLQKGKNFFIQHGGKSIVFGRFVGPVRPFVPVVAGMLSMPPRLFIITNVISALLWAPVYILPGLGISQWLL